MSLLTNVRLFDGAALGTPSSIGIRDGVFVAADAVSGDAETVDCDGAVLLPGLIDAHVHLLSPADLSALAAHGITTALDMACWPPETMHSFRGHVPDIRSAGIPAIGPGGNHSRMPGMPLEAILTDPSQAKAFVDRRVTEGSDYIKVVVDGDLLSQATVDAVVDAAHAHSKQAIAHAATVDSYRKAVRSGADVITHVPRDGVLDADTVAEMADREQIAVPTLTMMQAVLTALGGDYACCPENVAALDAAGIPIVAGTDAFAGAPLVAHGSSLHLELELLVAAGLGEAAALRSATSLAARSFGLTDRGTLAAGLRADAVLIGGDPLRDIAATKDIRRIWSAGVPVAAKG
jgi:imidazolonepropionase-like amidohydrolase